MSWEENQDQIAELKVTSNQIWDCLDCAEIAESELDFDSNVEEAINYTIELLENLKELRK